MSLAGLRCFDGLGKRSNESGAGRETISQMNRIGGDRDPGRLEAARAKRLGHDQPADVISRHRDPRLIDQLSQIDLAARCPRPTVAGRQADAVIEQNFRRIFAARLQRGRRSSEYEIDFAIVQLGKQRSAPEEERFDGYAEFIEFFHGSSRAARCLGLTSR